MDKWEKLRHYMKADIAHAVSYSSDRQYEHGVSKRYLKYMENLDKEEQEYIVSKLENFDDNDIQGLS
jgi:hypothetical protein